MMNPQVRVIPPAILQIATVINFVPVLCYRKRSISCACSNSSTPCNAIFIKKGQGSHIKEGELRILPPH